MEDTENNEENRCKDSSGIDTWVKVLAITLIILVLFFGVGIIASMVRGDTASTTTLSGNNRVAKVEQTAIISYGNPFVGHTGGADYQIALERTGGPAGFKLTWKNSSGDEIHSKTYRPGEYDKIENWVVRASQTLTAEMVDPKDDPLTIKFVVH